MDLQIRAELPRDFDDVDSLVKLAFEHAEHCDGDEHNLVRRIRGSDAYIPSLSLIAAIKGQLVGHIMLSSIRIGDYTAVTVAPLSVHPSHQGKGIGSALLREAHEKAKLQGYTCCVLLGDPAYYTRFGYQPAELYGIHTHLEVPSINYMALSLQQRSVPSGFVVYPSVWGF